MFLNFVPAIMIATMMMGALIEFIMYDPVKTAALQNVAINLLQKVQNAAETQCKGTCADGAIILPGAILEPLAQSAQMLKGSIGMISLNGNVICWFTYAASDTNAQLMSPSLQMTDAARSTLGQYSAALGAAQGYPIRVASGWTAPAMNLAIPAGAGVPDKAIILAAHR
ncbi:MAG TPA: hypothetical protein P5256_18325 [Beijerinckiaceae bacterium]|nr:hypothetical protein [Hyphomicrobiales bacterium]MCO5085996.1 hypothetical protein [Methylobacteriaceae bacterium]HRY05094.1 hypothetical protein [Beijerinckiaceae bacterium]